MVAGCPPAHGLLLLLLISKHAARILCAIAAKNNQLLV